ncbi:MULTISPECIES: DUF6894 family protein [unclassified Bradyrhizobium]|uniref:DUF6894 family protein n=1 Tax=unclassified Bradyrhizobium TaxID=2631580 RepID=UPI002FEE97B1
MPHFFFAIESNGRTDEPTEAIELADLDAAWQQATKTAGEIVRDLDGGLEPDMEWSIQVQDEQRKPLRTIKVVSQYH